MATVTVRRPTTLKPSVSKPTNISSTERTMSTVGGAMLLVAGLTRGKLSGLLLSGIGAALVHRGWTGHCYGYEAFGINTAKHQPATSVPAQQGIKVERTIAVQRSPDELFSFWRDVSNLPTFMQHLEEVQVIDERRSHWTAKGPMNVPINWEAEIINEREPELIAWRSLPGSQVETAGSVHFTALDGDRGTAIAVSLKYNPPAGKVAAQISTWLGTGLEQMLEEDLHRFKSLMETGEAPRA